MSREPESDPAASAATPGREPDGPANNAEAAYGEFRQRREAGEELDFNTYCEERRDIAAALRILHSLEGNIAIEPVGESFLTILERRFRSTLEAPPHTDAGAGKPPDSSSVLDDLLSEGRRPRYEVDREIARGGMGRIVRVWDKDLLRVLAMKVLRGPAGGAPGADSPTPTDRGVLLRFLDEAHITAQLDHPGIVPVHELGLDPEGRVYFTMPLVKGNDLSVIFGLAAQERDGWNRTRALGSLVKVCEAVAFAHTRRVIHRDLKPANVMVGRFGETYVMDWGLAKVLGDDREAELDRAEARDDDSPMDRSEDAVRTQRGDEISRKSDSSLRTLAGTIVGTPAYMPPEQAAGRIDALDARTDVYSIGAMLYELLAGRPPHADRASESPLAVLEAIRAGPPTKLSTLAPDAPPELVAVCEKAMARDSEKRYASAVEMAGDLQAFLDDRVVKAYRTGAVVELRKWVSRNRTAAAALAAAVVFAVGGLATFAFQQARSRREMVLNTDIYVQEDLAKRADAELWPALPETAPAIEGWLEDARSIVARLEVHRERLRDLRSRALPGSPDAKGAWLFLRADDTRRHLRLLSLVEGLQRFVGADGSGGLISEVQERLDFALSVRERTIDAHREDWSRVLAEIADTTVCPAYGGLRLEPQIGLVPLGRDPRSGLHEFAHIQTGSTPRRGEDGSLLIDDDSGLVFVLLPGGEFSMGSVRPSEEHSEGSPNVDPLQYKDEDPVRRIILAPFFISKLEMTQGQWLRFTGKNPSLAGPMSKPGELPRSLRNPIEHVNWYRCSEVTTRLGLTLPTEAQWEYAARAGTTTAWWTGTNMRSLQGAANLADLTMKESQNLEHAMEWLDDGHVVHCAVGSYRANRFGLHDVAGNVWEWCRDLYDRNAYDVPAAAGDAHRPENKGIYRVNRGGSFYDAAMEARSARRRFRDPVDSASDLGLRPVRVIITK